MIITVKPNASNEVVKKVTNLIESKGLTVHPFKGFQVTIVGVVGDKAKLLDTNIEISGGADKVVAVTESYKLVDEKFHPEDSVIPVGSTYIDPGTMTAVAGLCATESLDQPLETAYAVKKAGTTFLRGGTYKLRTFPYSFQGLKEEGLKCMETAREATGLNVVCEVTSAHATESVVKHADMLQIGARNMQNFELLKETGESDTPVLLKRGLCATTDEWLNAAECTISEGNPNIMLCERGIHIYEVPIRDTLDVSAVPVIRQKSHPPTIVNPSHAAGVRAYVKPLTKAVIVVGADGLMIEIHPRSAKASSDGPQSLTFDAFGQPMKDLAPYAEPSGRTFKAQ